MLAIICLLGSFLRRLISFKSAPNDKPLSLPAVFSLLTAIIYIGMIMLSYIHDRYLIPICALAIIGLISSLPEPKYLSLSLKQLAPALLPLLLMGVFSILGVHDFMEMKRSLTQAQDYLVRDLQVDPCNMDGGFEFNGYYCCRQGFKPSAGLSWWWVGREDYLITLGPLAEYQVIRTYPFSRYMGPNGSIHILQPIPTGS